MNITFQSVNFKASESLENLVRHKVSKLFIQKPELIRADISLFEGAQGNINNKYCDINLSVPGENYFVKKNSEKHEKSISDAVNALLKQMRREKKKKISGQKTK